MCVCVLGETVEVNNSCCVASLSENVLFFYSYSICIRWFCLYLTLCCFCQSNECTTVFSRQICLFLKVMEVKLYLHLYGL